jgi:hypothetical protein
MVKAFKSRECGSQAGSPAPPRGAGTTAAEAPHADSAHPGGTVVFEHMEEAIPPTSIYADITSKEAWGVIEYKTKSARHQDVWSGWGRFAHHGDAASEEEGALNQAGELGFDSAVWVGGRAFGFLEQLASAGPKTYERKTIRRSRPSTRRG